MQLVAAEACSARAAAAVARIVGGGRGWGGRAQRPCLSSIVWSSLSLAGSLVTAGTPKLPAHS